MKSPPLTKLVLHWVSDLKAADIRLLDVREQTPMTDAMVVCTGTSSRHVRAIAENVVREAKLSGRQPQGVEGLAGSEWVLVDLGDVVVHVMQAQARAFYQLEKLWDMAPPAVEAIVKPGKPRKASPARQRKTAKKAAAKKKSTRTPARKKKAAAARR